MTLDRPQLRHSNASTHWLARYATRHGRSVTGNDVDLPADSGTRRDAVPSAVVVPTVSKVAAPAYRLPVLLARSMYDES